MMDSEETLLLQRYRRLLSILPPSYRAAREEEMVSTFAEGVGDTEEEGLGKPSWTETTGVLALAIRTWLGGVGAPVRLFMYGQTVRLLALLGMFFQAILAGAGAVSLLGAVYLGSDYTRMMIRMCFGLGELDTAWNIVWTNAEVAWIPAYVALLLGHRRTARFLTLLAVAPMLIRFSSSPIELAAWWPGLIAELVLVLSPVVAMTVGFHRDAPAVRPGPWLCALPVGVGVIVAWNWLPLSTLPDELGLYCWLLLAAAVAWAAAASRRSTTIAAYVPLALALAALVGLVSRALTFGDYPEPVAVLSTQTAAVLLVACLCLTLGLRELRRTSGTHLAKN